jgi:hypothetical protein
MNPKPKSGIYPDGEDARTAKKASSFVPIEGVDKDAAIAISSRSLKSSETEFMLMPHLKVSWTH